MDDEPFAPLRSVMVDGSPRGRVEGAVHGVALSADGRHALFAHRSWDGRTDLATRCSLDDGRCERLAASPRAGKSHLWHVSSSGRAFDLAPRALTLSWRDPDGRSGAVPLRADERVHGLSHDGAHVVLARAAPGGTALRVVAVEGAATRCDRVMADVPLPQAAVGDRFAAHTTVRGALQRVRFDDGDVREVSLGATTGAWSCVVAHAGSRVAVANAQRAAVFALDDLREVASVELGQGAQLRDLAGDTLLTYEPSERDYPLVARDLATGASRAMHPIPPYHGARLTPDARRIVYAANGVVRLYDIARGRHVDLHDGPDAFVWGLAWSPDGTLLAAVCADGTVRVIDVRRGAVPWTLEGAPTPTFGMGATLTTFSPDGRALYGVSPVATVTWSLATGQEIARDPAPGRGSPVAVATSPDGRWIAAVVYVVSDAPRLALLDAQAGMRCAVSVALPWVSDARDVRLRFEGADELRWFVRHATHRGQAAVFRLGLDGRVRAVARKGLRGPAQALPVERDERLMVCDRGLVAITTLDVFLLLLLMRRGFRTLEAFIMVMLATIFGCFAIQIAMAQPAVAELAAGFIPTAEIVRNPEMLYIAIGILGATVMPHNLYLHSSIVQTRAYPRTDEGKREAIRFATIDSTVALTLALFVNASILIMAASVFHANGRFDVAEIETAYELLSPMLGVAAASTLFALALLASGTNSTITATLAGQITTQGFLRLRIPAYQQRLITRAIAVVPVVVVTAMFGESGTAELLVASQVVLSMQLPFAIWPLLRFVSDRGKMGVHRPAAWVIGLAVIIATLITVLNIKLLVDFATG